MEISYDAEQIKCSHCNSKWIIALSDFSGEPELRPAENNIAVNQSNISKRTVPLNTEKKIPHEKHYPEKADRKLIEATITSRSTIMSKPSSVFTFAVLAIFILWATIKTITYIIEDPSNFGLYLLLTIMIIINSFYYSFFFSENKLILTEKGIMVNDKSIGKWADFECFYIKKDRYLYLMPKIRKGREGKFKYDLTDKAYNFKQILCKYLPEIKE